MAAVPEAVARELRRHGVVLDPAGDAWAVLVAATEARRGRFRVEEAAVRAGHHRPLPHRALVWQVETNTAATLSARGRGATEEEALARALLVMLDRETPEPGPGGADG